MARTKKLDYPKYLLKELDGLFNIYQPGPIEYICVFNYLWSKEELEEIVYRFQTITLIALRDDEVIAKKTYKKKSGFTRHDLIKCIIRFENVARLNTMWFDEVDVYHTHFEGIRHISDEKRGDVYEIMWTSN